MPDDPPALEAINEVAGHRRQKLFHAEMVRKTGKKAIGFGRIDSGNIQHSTFNAQHRTFNDRIIPASPWVLGVEC
jgi:hypothetical protein